MGFSGRLVLLKTTTIPEKPCFLNLFWRRYCGGYVFDDATERETAARLKRAKEKTGNPFHDVNEVHRLIYEVSNYYRRMLEAIIDHDQLEIDWAVLGL
jgi:GTP1/Obg family GTP-binding protein